MLAGSALLPPKPPHQSRSGHIGMYIYVFFKYPCRRLHSFAHRVRALQVACELLWHSFVCKTCSYRTIRKTGLTGGGTAARHLLSVQSGSYAQKKQFPGAPSAFKVPPRNGETVPSDEKQFPRAWTNLAQRQRNQNPAPLDCSKWLPGAQKTLPCIY